METRNLNWALLETKSCLAFDRFCSWSFAGYVNKPLSFSLAVIPDCIVCVCVCSGFAIEQQNEAEKLVEN